MSITVLTGLPGSGKSSRLIEMVNTAVAQGSPALTFLCSDFPWLMGYESYVADRQLASRRPGLSCRLNHFVTTVEFAGILSKIAPATLVAVEEAQTFGVAIVPSWIEASNRGLELVITSPSAEQLELLQGHQYTEIVVPIICQKCATENAVTVVIPAEGESTLSLCRNCFDEAVEVARQEILERLRLELPHPGKEAIYQPVGLRESAEWSVSRPDSEVRADILERVISEVGLLENAGLGHPTYLDIGCNTGYFCDRLQRIGFYAKGIDAVENDIVIARLLDSFFRRRERPNKKFVTYRVSNAYDYLQATQHEVFNVTSAFSVFQWVMSQRSVEDAVACFEWMFAKTKNICILEMGYSSQDNYASLLPVTVDRAWVLKIMEEKGDFAEIRIIDAQKNDLMRDLFIGFKSPVTSSVKPADRVAPTKEPQIMSALAAEGSKYDNETQLLSSQLAEQQPRADSLPSQPKIQHKPIFERIVWQEDRMLLDEMVFRLQHFKSDNWELGDECFIFYKTKGLVDQYENFWALRKDFQPRNIFELGIWEGGSVVFWFECFQPEKHIAIDLSRRSESEYLQRYVKSRGLEGNIKNYRGVDQSDAQKLREIVDEEFHAPLDLVIDDASHLYAPTKSSFETLFPLLRPGGLYIIEDWAWALWPDVLARDPKWSNSKPLTELVVELVESAGTRGSLIRNMSVYRGFVVIERGEDSGIELRDFKLEHQALTRKLETEQALQSLRNRELVEQIRQAASKTLLPDSILLVVSKGDDDLLKLNGQSAWHFPRADDGVYAGYYPTDSAEAIALLEKLRADGAQYLLFPQTAFWWFEYYQEFRRHLETSYQIKWNDQSCVIYELRGTNGKY